MISISPAEPGGCRRIAELLQERSLSVPPETRTAMLAQTCTPGSKPGTQFSIIFIKENESSAVAEHARAALEEEQRQAAFRLAHDPDFLREEVRKATREDELDLDRRYLTGYIRDAYGIVASPFSWNSSDWIRATVILAVTGGLYASDDAIRDYMQSRRNDATNAVAKVAEPFGRELILPGLGLMYVAGKLKNEPALVRGALLGLESAALTTLFLGGVKMLAGRQRPYTGSSHDGFEGPGPFEERHASFPSGHSGAAFAVAAVLSSEIGEREGYGWVTPLAYGVATLTALSRVNDDQHWASDVFMGAAIGYGIGKWISSNHRNGRDSDRKQARGWRAYPVMDVKGRFSLALQYLF
ncbi:MAG: phosphatase PAP2 family protein [Oligoflexia bacterium]|nr:phosphatase PAP2 family protein [Oligoflexia bacterium]